MNEAAHRWRREDRVIEPNVGILDGDRKDEIFVFVDQDAPRFLIATYALSHQVIVGI